MVRMLLAAALAVGLASAQRGGGGGGGGMGGDTTGAGSDSAGTGSGMRAPRQTRLDIIADKLHLKKEQKEEAGKIFAAAQEEAGPLNEQVRQGRNVITSAILDGKTGEDLNKLMAEFANLMAQKTAVEAKAYAKLYAILDAKQQAKAAPVFAEQMDGMFDRGGRAPGASRGGD